MAARRGKSQARRSGGSNNGLPGWAWLVIGVLLALVVVLMAPKFIGGKDGEGGFFRIGAPHANPDAQPQGSSETDGAFEPVGAEPAAKPAKQAEATDKAGNFDFYELLPGEEVAMTDAQIAAIAREEARRKAAEAKADSAASLDAAAQAADAQARATAAAAGLPQPLPEAGSTPAPAKPVQVASAQPAPKPATVPVASTAAKPATTPIAESKPPTASTPYVLQAGAFQASGDAEAVKAKIAMLGLNARVESASINGKTMYRVRMGPYATASELADAKSKLSSGGLPAVAVKAK